MTAEEMFISTDHVVSANQQGPTARISHQTLASLMGAAALAVNAIKADGLEEAAEALRASGRLRAFTDDHMGDVNEAADELRRMAAALRSTEKGSTDV